MTPFVLYQAADGRVLSSGTSFNPQSLAGVGQGILVVERPCDPCGSYVKDGQLIPMPVSPGEGYRFNYSSKMWELDLARAWHLVRIRRDTLLTESDWRLARAMEAGEPLSPEWRAYRQALRDVTDQADPLVIVWPMPPV
ncbi:phage tail assembly chaperone [Comamonas composti]|uniref:phage tail assembly chaperone n=1 Tax=Comamonas composti TaxID=408558 RepID=UPI000554E44C|nr:phage tail assembly chaperone [Comamonas composti]